MRTLHLNLKKKWFDMIFSGEKKEEYRDLTNYWFKRLCDMKVQCEDSPVSLTKGEVYSTLSQNSDILNHDLIKYFDNIIFSNGYAKDRPQFKIECKGIEIKEGCKEWGAIPGQKYFVIKLGKEKEGENDNYRN